MSLGLFSKTSTLVRGLAYPVVTTRFASSKPDPKLEEEYAKVRAWSSSLDKNTIPKDIAQFGYSRSSGAGGQHVNTTESKVTAKWPVQQLMLHVPELLHEQLLANRFYAKQADAIVIQAQESRKRNENEQACRERLLNMLKGLSKDIIPGATSAKQRAKVEMLQKNENAARLKMKKMQGKKKADRKWTGSRGE